jgi:excisionase family DNA binding protein
MLTEIAESNKPEMAPSLMEAARLIGVSYPTICRWRDLGQIKFEKVGGRYIVPMAEVVRMQGRNLMDATAKRGTILNPSVVESEAIEQIVSSVSSRMDKLTQILETFMVRQQELSTMMTHNLRVIAKRLNSAETLLKSVHGHTGDITEARTAMIALAQDLRLAKHAVAAAVEVAAPGPATAINLSTRSLVEVEAPPLEDGSTKFGAANSEAGEEYDGDEINLTG